MKQLQYGPAYGGGGQSSPPRRQSEASGHTTLEGLDGAVEGYCAGAPGMAYVKAYVRKTPMLQPEQQADSKLILLAYGIGSQTQLARAWAHLNISGIRPNCKNGPIVGTHVRP